MDSQVESSSSLKRKRPSKLEIPNVLREIFPDSKLDPVKEDAVCYTAPGIGVFSIQGKKKFMEDTHKVVTFPHTKKGFFGVYDGHGGTNAAKFVAENLHSNIYKMLENHSENKAKEEAIKAGYLKTDQEFLKQGLGSGACCVTVIIEGGEIVISNLGDCRVILCRGGKAEALTKDHKAGDENERKRIEDEGGFVEMHRGTWRINGSLAVSRSIGDANLKKWVPAEPDTSIIHLTPDMEFLVLASDGLWDEVNNQETADIVSSCLYKKIEFRGLSPLPRTRRIIGVKCNQVGPTHSYLKSGIEEDPFGNENQSPPSKFRRTLNLHQERAKRSKFQSVRGIKVQSPRQEIDFFKVGKIHEIKENSELKGKALIDACKELVNLAESRGSLDDITVMIIDLKQYME